MVTADAMLGMLLGTSNEASPYDVQRLETSPQPSA
jgi:hypothetical protein